MEKVHVYVYQILFQSTIETSLPNLQYNIMRLLQHTLLV